MIEINNLTTVKVDQEFIKKISEKVLEGEGKKNNYLSIALVGPSRIRELNKRYRRKNRITDVLAFPESKALFKKIKAKPVQKISGLGEITICFKEVKKNAKRYSISQEEELAKVLIHGILHLLGHNHEKGPEKGREMEEKQSFYLSEVFENKR